MEKILPQIDFHPDCNNRELKFFQTLFLGLATLALILLLSIAIVVMTYFGKMRKLIKIYGPIPKTQRCCNRKVFPVENDS